MKGVERPKMVPEDELLALMNLISIQLKQPELFQYIPRRHGEHLRQALPRERTLLALAIQRRGEFRDGQIRRHKHGSRIGKQTVYMF